MTVVLIVYYVFNEMILCALRFRREDAPTAQKHYYISYNTSDCSATHSSGRSTVCIQGRERGEAPWPVMAVIDGKDETDHHHNE